MKFTIENLQGPTTVKTKYGLKQKFRITSNGQQYDAWQKKGYTDNFKVGHSFEAELTGKPYQGIDTIQWPKQESFGGQGFNPSANQLNDAIKSQLERIERKIDRILDLLGTQNVFITPEHAPATEGLPTGEPAPHTDSDAPF